MALYVITGPPAAGKTTWVRQRARHGDVVIDLDALAQALTPQADTHTHPTAVLRCAQRARASAIDEALRHSRDTDVYVIHTLPKAETLQRYREHDAQVITVDPGRDVVMQRIAEQRHRSTRAVAARWYATQGDHHGERHGARSRSW
jgi:hypothetical protein